MPSCMIIFKILFSQKHCTLYLYANGHVWIPIYEFEICVSVKKHANRTPTFGNSSGIQKRLQKVVQVRLLFLLPGLAMETISVLQKFL